MQNVTVYLEIFVRENFANSADRLIRKNFLLYSILKWGGGFASNLRRHMNRTFWPRRPSSALVPLRMLPYCLVASGGKGQAAEATGGGGTEEV